MRQESRGYPDCTERQLLGVDPHCFEAPGHRVRGGPATHWVGLGAGSAVHWAVLAAEAELGEGPGNPVLGPTSQGQG